MKKVLLLFVNGVGYSPFEYENLSDLAAAFLERGIKIGDRTSIGDGTSIGYGTSIGDRTSIGDGTSIGYGAKIADNEIVKSVFLSGSKHSVLYWGEDVIQIGCKKLSISAWLAAYMEIGADQDYTPEQIAEYKEYIELISIIHEKRKLITI